MSGCKGKASSAIPASGTYVLTTFGGPDEPQPLACGGHSKSGSWYYAASRQRYGCGSRVRITANGKCVVAKTDDYGPDVCVEQAAGYPVMDVSPLVSKALFGQTSLGWKEKKKVQVEQVSDSTPLGVCNAGPPDNGGSGGGGSGGSSGGCFSHGQCNPGSDGSGLICVNGACVPGCVSDVQCPGTAVCVNGSCVSSAPSGGGSGGTGGAPPSTAGSCNGICGSTSPAPGSSPACYCDSSCTGYGDCCGDYAIVCATSGSGGSSGGGGTPCSSDGQCNPGNDGSGLICVGGQCVPGCKANYHCPGIKTCKSGQCV